MMPGVSERPLLALSGPRGRRNLRPVLGAEADIPIPRLAQSSLRAPNATTPATDFKIAPKGRPYDTPSAKSGERQKQQLRTDCRMRVLVCGGRDFIDRAWLFRELDTLRSSRGVTTIISECARGADSLGIE